MTACARPAGAQLSHNAGQKYCRMLPLEYSVILFTCVKGPYFKLFSCYLPIHANTCSLDLDQAQQNVGLTLDSNCLTL